MTLVRFFKAYMPTRNPTIFQRRISQHWFQRDRKIKNWFFQKWSFFDGEKNIFCFESTVSWGTGAERPGACAQASWRLLGRVARRARPRCAGIRRRCARAVCDRLCPTVFIFWKDEKLLVIPHHFDCVCVQVIYNPEKNIHNYFWKRDIDEKPAQWYPYFFRARYCSVLPVAELLGPS